MPTPPRADWRSNYYAQTRRRLLTEGWEQVAAEKEARKRADRWFQAMQNPRRVPRNTK